MAIGDSKTLGITCCEATNGYRDELASNLLATGNWPRVQFVGVHAFGGWKTSVAKAGIDTFLAGVREPAPYVLVNLGSNDFADIEASTLNEATWAADMGYILDAVHEKWPYALVYLMRPVWYGRETGYTLYNDTWIPNVLASRSEWAFVGPDERTFLSFPFNMTDATHPDSSGYTETAAQWQTVLGY